MDRLKLTGKVFLTDLNGSFRDIICRVCERAEYQSLLIIFDQKFDLIATTFA